MRTQPRICFVSAHAYPLLDPAAGGSFGGSEVRAVTFARALAARGALDVHFVVFDHGQPHRQERDGITVWSRVGERPAAPARKSLTQGLSNGGAVSRALARALRAMLAVRRAVTRPALAGEIEGLPIVQSRLEVLAEVDADVYVVHGNTSVASEVGFFCEGARKRWILLAGSDDDFHPEFTARPDSLPSAPLGITPMQGRVMNWNVRNAHEIVVQSERQRAALQKLYGRDGRVVHNPISLTPRFPRDPAPHGVLWVGKPDANKRPELCLEAARRMPEVPFVVVGAAGAGLPNVRAVESVPFESVEKLFAEAAVFLNTSRVEGFPNTFLQAAKYGVPIVSLDVDPGEMLSGHGAGRVCGGSVDAMIDALRAFVADASLREQAGIRARSYVSERHDAEKVAVELEDVILSVARRSA